METLSSAALAGLSRLNLHILKKSTMLSEGRRRSAAKGRSAEFSGYREYVPGDDMRYVDWNAYGRLDRLYIKEYTEEREGRLSILLDTSKSMDYEGKSALMAGVTAALSYVALSGRDSVYITDLAKPSGTFRLPSGKQGIVRLNSYLSKTECEGSIDIADAVMRSVKPAGLMSGLVVIISDFMDESFADSAPELLRYISYRGCESVLLQVLSHEEVSPTDSGALELVDMESRDRLRIELDRRTLADYEKAVRLYRRRLEYVAKREGARYICCTTDKQIDKILYEDLRVLYDI